MYIGEYLETIDDADRKVLDWIILRKELEKRNGATVMDAPGKSVIQGGVILQNNPLLALRAFFCRCIMKSWKEARE